MDVLFGRLLTYSEGESRLPRLLDLRDEDRKGGFAGGNGAESDGQILVRQLDLERCGGGGSGIVDKEVEPLFKRALLHGEKDGRLDLEGRFSGGFGDERRERRQKQE